MGRWQLRAFILSVAACMLLSSVASAAQFLIGRNNVNNAPALYKRSDVGGCSKTVLQPVPFGGGFIYVASGTDQNDIMAVHDSGSTVPFCLWTVPPLAPLKHPLWVVGDNGSDIIWGGNGTAKVTIEAGLPDTATPASSDIVVSGRAEYIAGGWGDQTFLITHPTSLVLDPDGENDLYCTKVDGVFSTTGLTQLFDDAGAADARYGPAAAIEVGIDATGGSVNRDRCSFAYVVAYYSVLGILHFD